MNPDDARTCSVPFLRHPDGRSALHLMVARVLRDEETAREFISQTLYELWYDLHHANPLTPDDSQNLLDETEVQLMNLVVIWRLLAPSE